MSHKYLAREDAPVSAETWEKLDSTMIDAARTILAGRRLIHVEGPYGLGMKALPLPASAREGFFTASMIPFTLIEKTFTLSKWDLAASEQAGVSLDTTEVYKAAKEAALMEDRVIFKGVDGSSGLLDLDGTTRMQLSPWDHVGKAAEEIVTAVTLLDQAGFHGPYSLALTPSRYNLLFRSYPMTAFTEMEHVGSIATEGVCKAPALEAGAILVASSRQFATIVIGQDMQIGFIGPEEGDRLLFSMSESLALRVLQPGSFCILGE
ncbi:MAG: bacteriocin family protein [Dehalococcoidia bacterium]|nr:bacteriocin family protein [Dehalococcoidia bacterium]